MKWVGYIECMGWCLLSLNTAHHSTWGHLNGIIYTSGPPVIPTSQIVEVMALILLECLNGSSRHCKRHTQLGRFGVGLVLVRSSGYCVAFVFISFVEIAFSSHSNDLLLFAVLSGGGSTTENCSTRFLLHPNPPQNCCLIFRVLVLTNDMRNRSQDTQNYWVFGLCPSSGIIETRKHSVSETGSVSVLRWGEKTSTLLGPFEIANLNRAVIEVSPLTWGRKLIQFPKRCVF
jgi:hypothetical protein